MATYTKETALYDTGAIAGGISDASEIASNYLTDISGGGVYVHAADTSSDPTAVTAKGVKITDQIDIIRNGDSVASFGVNSRIGSSDDYHIDTSSASVTINKEQVELFEISGSLTYSETVKEAVMSTSMGGSTGSDTEMRMRANAKSGNTSITSGSYDSVSDEYMMSDISVGASSRREYVGEVPSANAQMMVSVDGGQSRNGLRIYQEYSADESKNYANAYFEGSHVFLDNRKYLYGHTYDSESEVSTPQVLCGINNSNAFLFGYDSYSHSIGASYFDGNNVYIRSRGDVNVTGNIKVNGHTAIGTVLTGTRASSAGTVGTSYSTVASLLLTPGTWVITAFNSFNGSYNGSSASAGTRRVLLTSSSSGTTDAGEGSACGYAPNNTQVVVRTMLIQAISANTTYYLRAKSAQQVDSPYGNLKAVRIL